MASCAFRFRLPFLGVVGLVRSAAGLLVSVRVGVRSLRFELAFGLFGSSWRSVLSVQSVLLWLRPLPRASCALCPLCLLPPRPPVCSGGGCASSEVERRAAVEQGVVLRQGLRVVAFTLRLLPPSSSSLRLLVRTLPLPTLLPALLLDCFDEGDW